MSSPSPERWLDELERTAALDLQHILEERDREWWEEATADDDESE